MSWLLYKTNRFHFAVGLSSDNVQRTSKRDENISHATRRVLFCSHHVLMSSVRYQSTDARQNGIYSLNNQTPFNIITADESQSMPWI